MMAFGLISGTAFLAAAAVSAFFDRRLGLRAQRP